MNNLKVLRKGYHLTQKELGSKFSLSGNTIGQYENGEREPDLSTLKKMAKYFNVTVDYLIGNDDASTQSRGNSDLVNTPAQREFIEKMLENSDHRQGKLNNLKELRYLKGWSQAQAAEKIGVAQQTYANYENAYRHASYETLLKLAEMYDVTVDYLLGKESNNVPQSQSRKSSSLDNATPAQKELVNRALESSDRVCNRVLAYMDVITDRELATDLLKFKDIDL